jgi:hypothetical protein
VPYRTVVIENLIQVRIEEIDPGNYAGGSADCGGKFFGPLNLASSIL